jgi:glycerol-3-phosphate acyltransferase PlsY
MEHVFSLTITLGALLAFLSGSIPFSVWLGYYFARKDIRRYGDGNPGAANAWRAAGWRIGVTAMLLDYLKGALPVAIARYGMGMSDWTIVPIAIAPVLGHAFSPFLRFRGGKAVAVTMGVWSGLTLWAAPTVLGIALTLAVALNATDAWSVVFGMSVLLLYLLFVPSPMSLLIVWVANFAIILWKHRFALRTPPRPRLWLERLFRWSGEE